MLLGIIRNSALCLLCRARHNRHTFASQLVMNGIDLTTVKTLLGHKNIKMTLRYAHLAPAHMARAVEILGEKLTAKSGWTKTIQTEQGGQNDEA